MGHAVEVAPGKNLRHAVDMAADHVAAELVADLERALEIDAAALPPSAERRDGERLGPDIEGNARAPARLSTPTTVRQTPALAIEAPTSIAAAS